MSFIMPLRILPKLLDLVLQANGKAPRVRVLVVEDEDATRLLWVRALQGIGQTEVTSAASIAEALPLLKDNEILILDWRLEDGLADSLLSTWNRLHDSAPVMICTGAIPPEDRHEFYIRGVYNVFLKPVPIQTICSVVRIYVNYINSAKALYELRREVKMSRPALDLLERRE